jgi:hypoxanthine-guanine phosphoribosyltransferase
MAKSLSTCFNNLMAESSLFWILSDLLSMKHQMQIIVIEDILDTDSIIPLRLFSKLEFMTLLDEVLVEDGMLFAEHGHIITDTC